MGLDKTKYGTEAIVMAIRERIMELEFGTCIDRLAPITKLKIKNTSGYYYSYTNRPIKLGFYLENVPLLVAEKGKVTLYTKVLDRSPELRAIKTGVIDFLKKYTKVEIKENSDAII